MFRMHPLMVGSLTGFLSFSGAYGHLRRRVLCLFLVFCLVFGAVYSQRVKAFGPILIYPGIQLLVSSAGLFSLGLVSTVIGGAVLYFSFRDRDNTASVPIEVRINPKDAASVPSGWTPASNLADDPNPPLTAGAPQIQYSIAGGHVGNSPSEVCTSFANAAQTPNVCGSESSVTNGGATCSYKLQQAVDGPCVGPYAEAISMNSICPVGYSNSSGTCVLTSAALVRYPVDGKCRMKTTGGTFQKDAKDPDCDGSYPANFVVSPDNKVIEVKDGTSKTLVTSNPDNTIKVESWVGNGDGTSQYTAATIAAPDGASSTGGTALTGFSSGRVIGEGALAGDGSTAAGSDTGTGKCGAPGQPACRIDETGTPSGSTFSSSATSAINAKTPADFGVTPWAGSGTSVFSNMPTVAGSDFCANPITWVWMGHTLTPDMCAIWGPLKSSLAWLLYAMTAVYCWRRVTTAL